MILEGGEPGDGLAAYAEGRNPVGDHLLRFRDDLENGGTQRLKRAALRLLDAAQVLINLRGGHHSQSRPASKAARLGAVCLVHGRVRQFCPEACKDPVRPATERRLRWGTQSFKRRRLRSKE